MKQRSYIPGTGIEGRNFVGKNTVLKNCTLGYFSIVQGGSDITDSDIGRYTTIGSDVKTVIGSHPTEKFVSIHPAFYSTKVVSEHTYVKQDRFQEKPSERTRIGSDVWIGSNVLIMGGVNIGDGAVVGAGAVVT
ncbi:MAG: hypothetical protein K6G42_04155, partial [Lachnospiraceae bacterium]|nr:hypothetical protein [Lachnospiraceae bacterium]